MAKTAFIKIPVLALVGLALAGSTGCSLGPKWFARPKPQATYTGPSPSAMPSAAVAAATPAYQPYGPQALGMPAQGRYDAATIDTIRSSRPASYGRSRGPACST